MIVEAIRKELRIICVTEHMDYDNNNYLLPSFLAEYPDLTPDDCRKLFVCDTDSYLSEFTRLKAKYDGSIDLRFGIELGLRPDLASFYSSYIKKYPFDFIIGSTHEAGGIDPYYSEFLSGRAAADAYRFYFRSEIENAASCIDSFDSFGHIDYALRYHIPEGFIFNYSDYSDELDTLLRLLISHGKSIEVNTGGFKYFLSEPNPRMQILKRYRELGGELITVGSDAHNTADIARHFDKAQAILKECGFKYYSVFKNRTPEQFVI